MSSILQSFRRLLSPEGVIQANDERYLNQATDLCDLERRMRELDREKCESALLPIALSRCAPWARLH